MPKVSTSKKVLVAPLDWGLGHATRCVPVINEFLKQGCEVQIASNGSALVLLKEEFPKLKFYVIESYGVKYGGILPFMVKIIIQIPKILRVISKEHNQIEKIVEQEKIDIIISDNRYGCWSGKTRNVFISHQLTLLTPVFSSFVNSKHKRLIEKFSVCWVPDEEGAESLAGELAINSNLKPRYIGLLSRMKWSESQIRYEIMVILSGPEPQRSIFEGIMMKELKSSNKKCLVVRGLPGQSERTESDNCTYISHLNAQEINNAILESELIISRSGYSTIMDLAHLGKRAIFVPTPGQPEQEYLAEKLMKKKITFSMPQDSLNLQYALLQAAAYAGFTRRNENTELSKAVKALLDETN